METLGIRVDAAGYDAAVHGRGGAPSLPTAGPPEIIIKPNATVNGKAGAVIAFAVQLPDGSLAIAQCTVTAALIEQAGLAVRGWREGGHI